MGLDVNDLDMNISDPEVASVVCGLHDQMNMGIDCQQEIDRYLLYAYMSASKCSLLLLAPRETFILAQGDVLACHHMYDIGQYVRKTMLGVNSNELMLRMIQYSMPYVKHNRLNFPHMSDLNTGDLMHLLNIVLGCCLGIFRKRSKRPLWALRVKLYAFFHRLVSMGNDADFYLFCQANLNVMRLSIIEYFVFFVESCMPVEKQVLCYVFGLEDDIDDIFRQFSAIIDNFRFMALQKETMNWEDINSSAQVGIEKCNRVAKGKVHAQNHHPDNTKLGTDKQLVLDALASPRFSHPSYAFIVPQLRSFGSHRLANIKTIQEHADVYTLPVNITRMQAVAVQRGLLSDSNATLNCLDMHMCFRCSLEDSDPTISSKIRSSGSHVVFCEKCHSSEFMVAVCMLGRILRLRKKRFYFCVTCMHVHEWKSTGHEFNRCCMQQSTVFAVKCRSCALCERTTSLSSIDVLDDLLGVRHHITLCGRHFPLQFQLPLIYNIPSLVHAIKSKLNRYSPFIANTKK